MLIKCSYCNTYRCTVIESILTKCCALQEKEMMLFPLDKVISLKKISPIYVGDCCIPSFNVAFSIMISDYYQYVVQMLIRALFTTNVDVRAS